jgi:enamine deaminase RidA (YjgF/YER057c/UK114 family)
VACSNALAAAEALLAEGESLSVILSLTVYIAAEPGFTAHSKLADFASAFLESRLGRRGIGSRAAVGVATLPGNAPVEVQLVAAV